MEKEFNEKIITEFKKRRRRQYIVTIVVFLILLYMKSEKINNFIREIYQIDGLDLILALVFCLIFSLFNWRCPACSSYLGRSILPKYCNKCGAKLR